MLNTCSVTCLVTSMNFFKTNSNAIKVNRILILFDWVLVLGFSRSISAEFLYRYVRQTGIFLWYLFYHHCVDLKSNKNIIIYLNCNISDEVFDMYWICIETEDIFLVWIGKKHKWLKKKWYAPFCRFFVRIFDLGVFGEFVVPDLFVFCCPLAFCYDFTIRLYWTEVSSVLGVDHLLAFGRFVNYPRTCWHHSLTSLFDSKDLT